MRWKKRPIPVSGEVRIYRKFLFVPTSIGNEWRWLEFANFQETYNSLFQVWTDKKWIL